MTSLYLNGGIKKVETFAGSINHLSAVDTVSCSNYPRSRQHSTFAEKIGFPESPVSRLELARLFICRNTRGPLLMGCQGCGGGGHRDKGGVVFERD